MKVSDRRVSFGSNTEHIIAGRYDPEPSIAKNVIVVSLSCLLSFDGFDG